MVVTEAMAHGTPVLATDTGGIAMQIGGAGVGSVMPPFAEPQHWAEAIIEMTEDRMAYEMMSDAAYERAGRHLSWANWAESVEGIVREALASGAVGDVKASVSA